MKFIAKYKRTLIGVAVGAVGGYAYYHFVGCAGGTCAITSHPLNSTAYGAVMGALLFTGSKKESPNRKNSGNAKQEDSN